MIFDGQSRLLIYVDDFEIKTILQMSIAEIYQVLYGADGSRGLTSNKKAQGKLRQHAFAAAPITVLMVLASIHLHPAFSDIQTHENTFGI